MGDSGTKESVHENGLKMWETSAKKKLRVFNKRVKIAKYDYFESSLNKYTGIMSGGYLSITIC